MEHTGFNWNQFVASRQSWFDSIFSKEKKEWHTVFILNGNSINTVCNNKDCLLPDPCTVDNPATTSNSRRNSLVGEVWAPKAFVIDSTIPLHIFPFRVNSTWWDHNKIKSGRYILWWINYSLDHVLTPAWRMYCAAEPGLLPAKWVRLYNGSTVTRQGRKH